MRGLVNPVGPEGAQVYWIRRVLLVAAVVLLVLLLVWVFGPRGEQTAVPLAMPSVRTPQPTATPTPEATPSESVTPEPTATSSASPTDSSAPATASAADARTSTPTPAPSPAAMSACDPAALRVTLTAKRIVYAQKPVEFDLSIINGSQAECSVEVSAANLELKVYSGTDRIWSTKDCAKWVAPAKASLKPEQAMSWKMIWPAARSAKECALSSEVLRAGTYVATAHLSDAKPVQHVMNLR